MPNNACHIGAVVVAYRSAGCLLDCLNGLFASGAEKIVVVDNAQDSATRALVECIDTERDNRVRYHAPVANLGYGRAVNVGLRMLGDADWIVVVGPDVVLTERLPALTNAADQHHAALIAGQLLPDDPRSGINVRPLASPIGELRRALLGNRRTHAHPILATDTCSRVGQIDGCFVLARRQILDQLGGFDERFELYFEDVDLCQRAHELGGSWLCPTIYGHHRGGASSQQVPAAAYSAFRISRLRYLRKHWGAFGSFFAILAAATEIATRTFSRQPEGLGTRLASLALQLKELAHPGAVWVLPGGMPTSRTCNQR